MRTELFINNEFGKAQSGKTYAVENPATEEIFARVAEGDKADIDAAVSSAKRCFECSEWQSMSARQRGRLLFKLADLLFERRNEFAEIETRQNGKPLFESKIEISMCVETLRYFAGWTDKIAGETIATESNCFVYTLKEPVGVVGAIVPWNFPLNLACWKIGPALAAGCTIVLKPALETPLTALAFAELVQAAGFPPGAFNVVTGDGPTAGAALAEHVDVDKLTFTGSTTVGRLVMAAAAKTNKRITLELGGKSPNIVFADSDIKNAVRGALNGIFYGKGEVCAAGSRLLVEKSVHEQVVEGLIAGAAKRVPGDPMEKTTRLGAIVSKKQKDRVLNYINKGKDEGAKLVAGGNASSVNGKGHFVEATVFDQVQSGMCIAEEEIFGPVLAVMSFDGLDEAVSLANKSLYGLAAGIWTKDIEKAHRVARAMRAGTVWINTYNLFDPAAPFGGFKGSGFGRDLGHDSLNGYLETKTVWVNLGK